MNKIRAKMYHFRSEKCTQNFICKILTMRLGPDALELLKLDECTICAVNSFQKLYDSYICWNGWPKIQLLKTQIYDL